jgi:hypothetical protein
VVFVTVGQHDSDNVIQTVSDVSEVGQDYVDARLVLFREQHTAVDDEQFPVHLEYGHVATNFADSAERNNAKGVRLKFGRSREC